MLPLVMIAIVFILGCDQEDCEAFPVCGAR